MWNAGTRERGGIESRIKEERKRQQSSKERKRKERKRNTTGHTTRRAEYSSVKRRQKHGRALHAVFWFISTMLLRHIGLVNKVQKYITQT